MSSICQLLTGHVAVTRNLARRNIRCDNYCPRCGELEESITHAIFECPHVRQLYKFGPYHQLQQAHIYLKYQESTQIWITYSGGKTTLLNQN